MVLGKRQSRVNEMVMGNFESKWIENEQDFSALAPEWDSFAQLIDAPIFLRHSWFHAAWQWAKLNAQLKILIITEKETIVAICPFILQSVLYYRIPVNELGLLTIPDTQFCDWLVHTNKAQSIFNFVMNTLKQTHFRWDIFNWRLLQPASFIASQSRLSFNSTLLNGGPHYYVHLKPDWEHYYKDKSRRLKKGNNSIANKLTKAGHIELCCLEPTADSKKNILDIITTISAKSWKTEMKTALNFRGPQAFISSIFDVFSNSNSLKIWLLKLNNTPIAYELQLYQNGNYYALRSDYDPEFHALSPGTFLNWKIIQSLFGQPAENYFMGPGKNEYKLRWQNQETTVSTLRGYNLTFKGNLLLYLDRKIVPILRPIKHKIIKLTRG